MTPKEAGHYRTPRDVRVTTFEMSGTGRSRGWYRNGHGHFSENVDGCGVDAKLKFEDDLKKFSGLFFFNFHMEIGRNFWN